MAAEETPAACVRRVTAEQHQIAAAAGELFVLAAHVARCAEAAWTMGLPQVHQTQRELAHLILAHLRHITSSATVRAVEAGDVQACIDAVELTLAGIQRPQGERT